MFQNVCIICLKNRQRSRKILSLEESFNSEINQQQIAMDPSPWEELNQPGMVPYDALLDPPKIPQHIKNHRKRNKQRPKSSTTTRNKSNRNKLISNRNPNSNGRNNSGTTSSSHFEFQPGHNRVVGGHSAVIRPFSAAIHSKSNYERQQIEVMRLQ